MGMPARDLARIAYCMLRQGEWNGRQVIPRWFVNDVANGPNLGRENLRHAFAPRREGIAQRPGRGEFLPCLGTAHLHDDAGPVE